MIAPLAPLAHAATLVGLLIGGAATVPAPGVPTATAAVPTATATAVPPTETPTAAPRHPRVELDPTSIPVGTGATVNVVAQDFPPFAHLVVSWQTITGTAIMPGTPLVADSAGYASRGEMVPRSVAAGDYRLVVEGVGGSPQASAAITLQPPAGATGTPGQFCFVACVNLKDWWQASTQGLAQWWQGVTEMGKADLVQAITGVTTVVIDFTTTTFDGIFALAAPLLVWAGGALTFLVGLRVLAHAVTARAEQDGAHQALGWALLIAELAAVIGLAGGLKVIEHALWAWTAGAPDALGAGGLAGFGAALGTWTAYKGPSLAEEASWGLGTIAALLLLFVLTVQLVLLSMGVLAGWVLKLFLWLVGGLCVATAATPHTRNLALWWARSMLSVSLWTVVWVWMFGVEGRAIGSVATAGGIDPAKVANALIYLGVGIAMMLGVNAVPAVTRRGVALLIAGGGGVMDEMAGPVGALWAWAKPRVPLLGKL